jgi:hypothetical protein
MRCLLLRAGLLLLPFALFLGWFEVARGTRPTNSYLYKHRLLEAAAPRVDVLFLGSSHANDGIKPLSVTPGGFNLASVSQSLYYDAELVRRYLDDLPALRLVVLPVSYFSLGYETDRSPEAWRTYYYTRFHQIPQRDWHDALAARNFSSWFLFGRQFGLAALRGTQPGSVVKDYDRAGGTTPQAAPAARSRPEYAQHLAALAGPTLARHHQGWDTAAVEANRRCLSDCIRLLRRRGVGVVFVTLPVSEAYREGELPGLLATNRTTLMDLGHEFGIPWFDYSADSRFTAADFRDADHLGHEAAEKFSRMLGAEVVRPLLAGQIPTLAPVR